MRPALAQLADRDRLVAFCRKVWEQMEFPFADHFDSFIANESLGNQPTGFRAYLLWDEDEIVAVIAATPLETDTGPGFTVGLTVVDQERSDRKELLDYLTLCAALQAVSEKRYAVHSQTQGPLREEMYGRDLPGMKSVVHGTDSATRKPVSFRLEADARDIVKGLLEEHPQWRLL